MAQSLLGTGSSTVSREGTGGGLGNKKWPGLFQGTEHAPKSGLACFRAPNMHLRQAIPKTVGANRNPNVETSISSGWDIP